jgi:hypothetical protein
MEADGEERLLNNRARLARRPTFLPRTEMDTKLKIQIDGLSKLDQMEIERELREYNVSFKENTGGPRQFGYVPALTMITEIDPAVLGVVAGLIAAWLAKRRTGDDLDIKMSKKKKDGTEETLSIKSRKSTSEPTQVAVEIAKIGKELLEKH